MPGIHPSDLVPANTLESFNPDDGQWMDDSFNTHYMWGITRSICEILPSLFMPRSNCTAVTQLHERLAKCRIQDKPIGSRRAALVLAHANLATVSVNGGNFQVTAKTILSREKLDAVCESSGKTEETLMEELSFSLPSNVQELLGKRKRTASFDHPHSDSVTTKRQNQNTHEFFTPRRYTAPPRQPTTKTPPTHKTTSASLAHEDGLFARVKGRYCVDQAHYGFLRSIFFTFQDFEPDLNDDDFVKLIKAGSIADINSDLTTSWDREIFHKEARELMVKLGKSPTVTAKPHTHKIPKTQPITSTPKKVVHYLEWSSQVQSYNPLVYILKNTNQNTCIEPDFIKGSLVPYLANKFQTDYSMPLPDANRKALELLREIHIHPGNEDQLTYGQVVQIGWKAMQAGITYLEKHPKVPVKTSSIPEEFYGFPGDIQQSPEQLQTFVSLSKAGLISKEEYISLYQKLEGRILVNDQFPYQLQAYNWLKSSGQYSQADFVTSIKQGLCNSDIIQQLLKAKSNRESAAIWAEKLKNSAYQSPGIIPASPPPEKPSRITRPTGRYTSSKYNPSARSPKIRRTVRGSARRTNRAAATGLESKPSASTVSTLPSIEHLLNRKGLVNFGCTCYFNSACQQLSLAIPPETLAAIAGKTIQNKDAHSIRDAFVDLMHLVNREYLNATRQQERSRQQDLITAQTRLLTACYQHGQNNPGSKFRTLLPHTQLNRLGQEDSSEFFIALTEAIKMDDHVTCTLRKAPHFTYSEQGKDYTLRREANLPETLFGQELPKTADRGTMDLQSCINEQNKADIINKVWSEEEAISAGYPVPTKLADHKARESESRIGLESNDLSQFRSYSMMLGLTDFYMDWQIGAVTTRKLTDRGRKVIGNQSLHISLPVFDRQTQKQMDVPMALQSVVVHQGNSLNAGHYTTIIRSKEGPWVLFNDDQPVVQYKSLDDYLAEDKSRTPFLMNYKVINPVRP